MRKRLRDAGPQPFEAAKETVLSVFGCESHLSMACSAVLSSHAAAAGASPEAEGSSAAVRRALARPAPPPPHLAKLRETACARSARAAA